MTSRKCDDNAQGITPAGTPTIKLVSAWLALAALGYVLLVSWLDPAFPWPVTLSSHAPWTLVFLNLVPVLILHAALLAWTRRLLMHRQRAARPRPSHARDSSE